MTDVHDQLMTKKAAVTSITWTAWTQKRAVTIIVAVFGLLFILIMMNRTVLQYESHLATGDTVLLELAPVDPRGFMQGDYMMLSYAIEREIFEARDTGLNKEARSVTANEGYVIVAVDQHNVGQFVRLADNNKRDTLAANEMAIHYRIRKGNVQLATNAFFFQEGHSDKYEKAKYGLFRVNDKGEPLLTDMVDGAFERIEPNNTERDNGQSNDMAN